MRILLVEDNINLRVILQLVLEVKGFQPVVANDAAQALAVESTFDVVITDLNLPGINGLELSRQLRAKRPDCKTLIISGQSPNGYDLSAVDGWLEKPFRGEELVQCIVALSGVPT